MTRDEAIAKLVELDVARWGESEREASKRLHASRSHALALNAVANYDVDNIDADLAKMAKSLMTSADRAYLRTGG